MPLASHPAILLLLAHAHRWDTFGLTCLYPSDLRGFVRTFQPFNNSHMPILRAIHLSRPPDRDRGSTPAHLPPPNFQHIPHLTHFACPYFERAQIDLPWSQLTHLSRVYCSPLECLALLRACSALVYLEIALFSVSFDPTIDFDDGLTLTHPTLHTLEIHNAGKRSISKSLDISPLLLPLLLPALRFVDT
jgi:hypothetical protein